MRKNKFKKILMISLITLLAIGTLGMSLAFFGKDDFNWVKNKVEDAFVQEEEIAENRNLIYNSDFSINTSETTVFTDENSGAYNSVFMDGWFNNNANCKDFEAFSVEGGMYLKIGSTETAEAGLNLSQKVYAKDKIYGNTVTMSMSVNDVVYSKTVSVIDDSWYTLHTDELTFSMLHNTSNDYVSFVLVCSPGFDGVVNWVQVEQGDVFTGYTQGPAEYIVPTTPAVG